MLNGIRPEAVECVRIRREFGLVAAAIYAAEHGLPVLNQVYVALIRAGRADPFTEHAKAA
jgi:hypothetical protein